MIIVVSGQIAVGKSTLADDLAQAGAGQVIRVRQALADLLGVPPGDRAAMQVGGAELDRRTNGRWLCEYVEERSESAHFLVVDAVRTVRQTQPLLNRLTDTKLVFLRAHETTRRGRYRTAALTDPLKAAVLFEVAMNHPTERGVDAAVPLADLLLDTDDLDANRVAAEVQRAFGIETLPRA